MRKIFEAYFMPIMVLIVVFLNEICSCLQIITGTIEGSVITHRVAIVLATMTYLLLFYDLCRGKFCGKDFKVLVLLAVIAALYAITPSFYSGTKPRHFSYLLVFISEAIPSAYIGVRASRGIKWENVNKLLPFFVLVSSLLIGTIGLKYASIGERVGNDDSGLNYQSVSYFMAFGFSYSCYYSLIVEHTKPWFKSPIWILMLLNMLFCAMMCLVSGGRGAFVYIVVIASFLLYYYLKSSKKKRFRAIISVAIIIAVVVWMIGYFDVMESAGMLRVMDRLTEDDSRMWLYRRAYNAFLQSPILGNGVGSVWWTVGFFCHNMFLDVLSETGIVGISIVLYIFGDTLIRLYKWSSKNKIFFLLIIIMSGALVRNMFSGYWVAAVKLFFICSFVYCIKAREVLIKKGFIKY